MLHVGLDLTSDSPANRSDPPSVDNDTAAIARSSPSDRKISMLRAFTPVARGSTDVPPRRSTIRTVTPRRGPTAAPPSARPGRRRPPPR
jgi:hypothetical protein